MKTLPTCKPESNVRKTEFEPRRNDSATRSGHSRPEKFSMSVLNELDGEETVNCRMFRLSGKFRAVARPMATAFHPELVIMMSLCEDFGSTPRDQEESSSQLPLEGLVQLLTCAGAARGKETKKVRITRRRTRFVFNLSYEHIRHEARPRGCLPRVV